MSSNKTPITPDGLFKLGAKEVKEMVSSWYTLQIGSGDHCMEIIPIFHGLGGYTWSIELVEIAPRGFDIPRDFDYIEEIQELYKSLTGEELKEVDNGGTN